MNKYRHHPQLIVKPMPSDQQMHLPISVYILDITVTSQNNVSKQGNKNMILWKQWKQKQHIFIYSKCTTF